MYPTECPNHTILNWILGENSSQSLRLVGSGLIFFYWLVIGAIISIDWAQKEQPGSIQLKSKYLSVMIVSGALLLVVGNVLTTSAQVWINNC
jgi:hypothetical protein